MTSAVSKAFIIMIMLLSLVGQSLANIVMPCEMTDSNHQMGMEHSAGQSTNTMTASLHEGMKHHVSELTEPQNQSGQMDCCDVECSCPTNACSSYSLVSIDVLTMNTQVVIEKILILELNSPISIHKSHFRPPILV